MNDVTQLRGTQFCDARYKGVSSICLGFFNPKAMMLRRDVILFAVRKQRGLVIFFLTAYKMMSSFQKRQKFT